MINKCLVIVHVGKTTKPWCLTELLVVQLYAANVSYCKHCSTVNVVRDQICEKEGDEAESIGDDGVVGVLQHILHGPLLQDQP